MATVLKPEARDYVGIMLCYMEDVIDGTQPAGRLVRLACERQWRDLERARDNDPDFPYVFDVARAVRICRFKEGLPHIKGDWAKIDPVTKTRPRLVLEPWQVFRNAVLYGWIHRDTGRRRFRKALILVARKNAKSTDGAGDVLYLLCADNEPGAEVYCAATGKKQAAIPFNTARDMVRACPELKDRYGIIAREYDIKVPSTNSVCSALDAKGDTLDGLNIHGNLNDEVHAWKGRDLYEVLETATGSRAQPLMINITTAGYNRDGVCYGERAYAIRVLEGKVTDESFFALIYEPDPEDDPFDEDTWPKSNPNIDVSVYRQDLRIQAKQAAEQPAKLNGFLTKRLNIWTNAASAWLPPDRWAACADPELKLADFAGETAIAGIDLATRSDLCSRALLFERDGHFYAFGRHYLPEEQIVASQNAEYLGWVNQGWLTVSGVQETDQEDILADLVSDAGKCLIPEMAFDPFQAAMIMAMLTKLGADPIKMPMTVKNLSPAMFEIGDRVKAGKFHYNGDPVMDWGFSNVVCRLDERGNIYPRKETKDSPYKIDPAMAVIIAVARWVHMQEPEEQPVAVPDGFSYLAPPDGGQPGAGA